MIVFLLLAAAIFFTPVGLSPQQENQPVEKSLWELELQRIGTTADKRALSINGFIWRSNLARV
jgi:hypothetical protein